MHINHSHLKVALVAEHASIDFGGEAALPCHYFRELLASDVDVRLLVHERSRTYLERHFPSAQSRIHYVQDTWMHRFLHHLQKPLPQRLSYFTFGFLLRQLTQRSQVRVLRSLIAQNAVNVIHQVIPVSPKEPSALYGFGVPVLIGPMNGGMTFPPAFAGFDGLATHLFAKVGGLASGLVNHLVPGKLKANLLLVANERTKLALPSGSSAKVLELVENGVNRDLWQAPSAEPLDISIPQFVFVGRLVNWKAVDILVDAFEIASRATTMTLRIVGDGPERAMLEARAAKVCDENSNKIYFEGWLPQETIAQMFRESSALVLPSLFECGGAVVLEAMACGLPVIATKWGGPVDYLQDGGGILVEPTSRKDLVHGIAAAMVELSISHELQVAHRESAISVATRYSWATKAKTIIECYESVIKDGIH